MRRTPLVWQLYPPYLLIMLTALGAATFFTVSSVAALYQRQLDDRLESQARLIEYPLTEPLLKGNYARVDAITKELARAARVRATVILPDGKVIGDSHEPPEVIDNHADRPEIAQALKGAVGHATRFSATVRQRQTYVAVPLLDHGKVLAVVRTSVPAATVAETIGSVYGRILMATALIALLAALGSYVAARRVGRQLEWVKQGAVYYAAGDLSHRLPAPDSEELAQIAESMNAMGAELQQRMDAIISQRNQLEVVLASMVEGVLAFDVEERLLSMNRAAADLFQVDPADAIGKSMAEVIRHTDLQRFVKRTLESHLQADGDIVLYRNGERTLHAHGTVLRDARGRCHGALLVLNDVTNLRRLENARRDFVANVSHEIRTPITSIKGYVETLLDGALDEPDDARRFLTIVLRQADRLDALVSDLLTLSRIEEEVEKEELKLELGKLRPVLESAIQVCETLAVTKGIRMTLECDPTLEARINGPLLEQAVTNLLDNAIKYSPSASEVRVIATRKGEELAIDVCDEGCGIEAQHLERVFERFYRVDRARSRKLGGTGLGLAIVKHIVRLHGGRAGVASTPGKGSVFSIYLPNSS